MSAPLSPTLRQALAQVKLLVTDVDGVLTDGGLYYTADGAELKKFHVKDGQGMQLVQRAGIVVAMVTGSAAPAVLHRARVLGIQHVFTGVQDKLAVVTTLCTHLGLTLAQVAYVGDDVNDLAAMQAVGCPLTVADAMPANRACALYVTALPGGQGAVRELCSLLLQAHSMPGPLSERDHEP
jgi:3-deoxy-D-manno-octulosonate 8-phosphate phosphatase (KDO 8-P phosphatase)